MSRGRTVLFGVLSVLLGVAVFVVVLEVVLRFLPVADSLWIADVTSEDPVMHLTPDRDFVHSQDWDFALVNRGHVNNAGFINDQDYSKDGDTPLLAIVGDSYIEAVTVPYPDTVQGRLADVLMGQVRVYSFGASGAPLSQYLIWARMAVQEYDASAVIINVVGNDFDEGHAAYARRRGFWIYFPNENGELELQLIPFHTGTMRSILKYSALARYLALNLHIRETLFDRFTMPSLDEEYFGNTAVGTDPARMDASGKVIDAFLRDIPTVVGLPPDRVAFVLDGFRYPDEAEKGTGSYFARMRDIFSEKARAAGYEVIDMDRYFFADFATHNQSFQHPRDAHWNARAHGLVAEAILLSNLFARVFPGAVPNKSAATD